MAVSHNAKMVNAKNAVAEAEQTKKEAFTNYFPIVSATGMGFNADKGMAKMQLQPDMAMEMCKNGLMGGVTAVQTPCLPADRLSTATSLPDWALT